NLLYRIRSGAPATSGGRSTRMSEGRAEALDAREGRRAAQDLHRLEQRRADAAARHGGAERTEGEAGLEAHAALFLRSEQGCTQRLLDLHTAEHVQGRERGGRGVEHRGGLLRVLGEGVGGEL